MYTTPPTTTTTTAATATTATPAVRQPASAQAGAPPAGPSRGPQTDASLAQLLGMTAAPDAAGGHGAPSAFGNPSAEVVGSLMDGTGVHPMKHAREDPDLLRVVLGVPGRTPPRSPSGSD